jgi:transmembrane sensor
MTDEYLAVIVRYLNNPEDRNHAHIVDQWRSQTPEHEEFFQEVKWIWDTSPEVREIDLLDVEMETRRFTARLKSMPARSVKRRIRMVQVAAACAVLSMLAVGWYFWSAGMQNVKRMTVTTGTNVQDTVHLSDGTVIYLDENTTVEFPQTFDDEPRKVHLKGGRAFFAVKHDKAHPFQVALQGSSVTVLGTSFTIAASQTDVNISVKTGSVGFNSTSNSYTSVIQAGNGVSYNYQTRELQLLNTRNSNDDAWLTNELVFADASLEEVLTAVRRYYKVAIQTPASIAEFRKFNATFRNNDLRTVMDVLEATYPVRFRQESFTSYSLQITKTSN